MKKLKGFTMTELMVALAVVGILIAIVTPAIFKNRPNKNKMMVKKSFYVAEQIVSTLINDGNFYPDKRDNCTDDKAETTCYWGFDDTEEITYEGEKYSGNEKFYKLFKNMINVKTEDDTTHVFYTSDGVKWDLSGTIGKWTSGKDSVGKFSDSSPAAGKGIILIDVNGDETPNTRCTESSTDCDQYKIEVLANGKMQIDPSDKKAIEYVTINTSIKDNL